ncbi:MAG: ankyrin repeat domain-containing protein [Lentisphaeria bacterium]|nr:ankyrin repeat domain-containing protein [Lentisphaeria bacterium]
MNENNETSIPDIFPEAVLVNELEYWASLGNTGKVKMALQNGSDINAASDNAYTALHGAAENGHIEVLAILLKEGADVNAKLNSGQTPLDLARMAGQSEAFSFLDEQR